MKVQVFLSVLRPYAAMIAANGNQRLATQMNALGEIWAPIMSWNVKDLLGRAWPKEPLPEAEPRVREFRDALVRLHKVVESVTKEALVKDLSALIDALEPREREDLDCFVQACRAALEAAQGNTRRASGSKKKAPAKPINEQCVAEWVQRLKASYQDYNIFAPLYNSLKTDKTVSEAEMAAIATHFAYDTPPKTKRAESLRRIYFVHESYMTSAAKSNFSGGKSAA